MMSGRSHVCSPCRLSTTDLVFFNNVHMYIYSPFLLLSPQIYLGGYTTEEQAALAFDIAAIKFRGAAAVTNFDISNYKEELESLGEVSAEELVLSLRRQSKGFSRGSSKFRGVTRHQKGRNKSTRDMPRR